MAAALDQPIRLWPVFRERIWGRESLAPLFPDTPQTNRIGEVWFTCDDNPTATGANLGELLRRNPGILGTAADSRRPGTCPLLVKLLFTSERLSVQVHPDNAYAARRHNSLGKTEAWYVLEATPLGEIAAGFRETLSPERLRQAARSGEIEQLLEWRKVRPGDVVFVPAGTVHAIGAGLTICEVQQNSDITYRLYDYGRARELHLEDGAAVSRLGRHQVQARRIALAEWREELLACAYFRIERLRPQGTLKFEAGAPYYRILICTQGTGSIRSEVFAPGNVWLAPAGNAEFLIDGPGSEWIFTYTAEEATRGVTEQTPAKASRS
jgi:mannose-6-phosphate isomerase